MHYGKGSSFLVQLSFIKCHSIIFNNFPTKLCAASLISLALKLNMKNLLCYILSLFLSSPLVKQNRQINTFVNSLSWREMKVNVSGHCSGILCINFASKSLTCRYHHVKALFSHIGQYYRIIWTCANTWNQYFL